MFGTVAIMFEQMRKGKNLTLSPDGVELPFKFTSSTGPFLGASWAAALAN